MVDSLKRNIRKSIGIKRRRTNQSNGTSSRMSTLYKLVKQTWEHREFPRVRMRFEALISPKLWRRYEILINESKNGLVNQVPISYDHQSKEKDYYIWYIIFLHNERRKKISFWYALWMLFLLNSEMGLCS